MYPKLMNFPEKKNEFFKKYNIVIFMSFKSSVGLVEN